MTPVPPPRRRLAHRACDVAVVLGGLAASFALFGRPRWAAVAVWLAIFVALTAFAILQRENRR